MKPLYKVGDRVLVKSKYDKGCTSSDYACCFLKSMLYDYGGKVCTIESVIERSYLIDHKISDDGYQYKLKEDIHEYKYQWSSGMFESEF